jgi:hypothetical protein
MEIYGIALATQGFESPRLQTSPPRLGSERLRLASQTSPGQAQLEAEFVRRSLLEFQTTGRSRTS